MELLNLARDATIGIRFLSGLPSFLRRPISLEEARASQRRRLERREDNFLSIAKRAIYSHRQNPYRRLLAHAGCQYGDLERLVKRDGLEKSLHALFRHGVFLTVDEFKGRRPAVRGSHTITVNPDLLRNPLSEFHVPIRTGGSRSQGTPVLIDFAFIRECATNTLLTLEVQGGLDWLKADWEVPGGGALFRLLKFSSFGDPPVRWFSQIDPAAQGLHPRYRWSSHAMHWGGLLGGVRFVRPVHVSVDDPLPIAYWMEEVVETGRIPFLFTFPSSAVRLCQAAFEAGVNLQGVRFMLAGEPITEARLAAVRRVGAESIPRYGSIESGPIGYACLSPEVPDDMHLLQDLHAVIQSGEEGEEKGFSADALLLSSLCPSAPFIMLNVSMGDQAMIVRRKCGCPLEQLGWKTHLHTIRSYEKLTSGGMTFLDADVIRILEEVLPARFGGAPTDYQLVEEESGDGRPHLLLLVHPRVGSLDTNTVVETFLESISTGSDACRVMGLAWQNAKLLRVERRVPYSTRSGKILHLHLGSDKLT